MNYLHWFPAEIRSTLGSTDCANRWKKKRNEKQNKTKDFKIQLPYLLMSDIKRKVRIAKRKQKNKSQSMN